MQSRGLLPRQQPGGLLQHRSRAQARPVQATLSGTLQQQRRRRHLGAGGSSGFGGGSSSSSLCRRHLAPPVRAAPLDMEEIRARRDNNPYIKQLNDEHGIDGFVEFYMTDSGLPAAYLFHPSGQTLEIYLQGATATRWLDIQGRNLLFVRPDARFEPGVPINSGVPLSFPQWRDGLLPADGFAGRLTWEVVETDLGFDFMNLLEPAAELARRGVMMVDDEGNSLVGGPFGDDGVDEGDEAEEGEAAAAGGGGARGGGGGDEGEPRPRRRGRPRKTDAGAAAAASGDDEDPMAGGGGRFVAAAAVEGAEGAEGGESAEQLLERLGLTVDDIGIDWGLVGDVAPYIKLRLADSAETRAMWPHPFELTCKISLMETDEFPDPKAGMRRGVYEVEDGDALERDDDEGEDGGGDADETEQLRMARVDLPDLDEDDSPPMQIKYEFDLKHTGPAGSEPFSFQLAATPHFATRDQASINHAPFVRALGLGAKNTFDYSTDPRAPRLSWMGEDYLRFGTRRIETVVINSSDAEVKFCPGDRTHYELLPREGFRDAVAYHPGPMPMGEGEWWRFYACLGAGRIAAPKTLKPGESWRAEYVIRRHERYWDPPMWDRSATQPLPPWLPPVGGEDEDEEEDEEGGGRGDAFAAEGDADGGWDGPQ